MVEDLTDVHVVKSTKDLDPNHPITIVKKEEKLYVYAQGEWSPLSLSPIYQIQVRHETIVVLLRTIIIVLGIVALYLIFA